jgi:hypothetical protein
VLLPAPLPPIRPTISAAWTAKSTCCTALVVAERLGHPLHHQKVGERAVFW